MQQRRVPPARRRRRRRRSAPNHLRLILLLTAAVAVCAVIFCISTASTLGFGSDKFYPGLYVNGVDLYSPFFQKALGKTAGRSTYIRKDHTLWVNFKGRKRGAQLLTRAGHICTRRLRKAKLYVFPHKL